MEVFEVVYVRSAPVSCSVRLIRYSRIIPCLSRTGGASHEKKTFVELTAYPLGTCGALVGTDMNRDAIMNYTIEHEA